MSIASELTLLAQTKEDLRKKLHIPKGVPFSEYKNYFEEWLPSVLFKDGKQGVWYDPSDKSTLFQDSRGIVPVTKDGDPVGLMLDKSQGLEQKIVSVNGSLNTANIVGWTWQRADINTVNYTVGLLEFINPTAGIVINCEASITPNTYYKIDYDIEVVNGAGVVGGFASTATAAPPSSIGTSNNRVVATIILNSGVNTFFNFRSSGTVESFKIRKCVISEIKGNHAVQTVSTSRPVYKTDGVLHWLQFDGVDDYIASNDFGLVQPHTYAVASTLTSPMLAGSRVLVDGLTTNSSSLGVRPAGASLYAGTGSYTPPPLIVGKRVFVAKFNGDNSTLLNNGIAGVVRQVGSNNPKGMTLGALSNGLAPSDTSIYGFISISKVTTNTEDLAVNTYLAAKSGVIL